MKRLLPILLAVLLLLTACAAKPSPGPQTTAPPTAPTTAPPTAGAPDDSDMLHVVMADIYSGTVTGVSACTAHMSKLAQDAGFPLVFETVTQQNLKDALDTRDDAVIILPRAWIAEERMDSFGFIGTEKCYPMGASAPVNRPALLVRNDIWEEYAPQLETGSDLADFLRLLDGRVKDVPCAAWPLTAVQLYPYTPFDPLALFMPERGWYSLQGVMKEYGTCSFGLWASSDHRRLGVMYEMDECAAALADYIQLAVDGVLNLYTLKDHPDLTRFVTLLCRTEDFTSRQHASFCPDFHKLDFSEYHIAVLYKDTLPEIDSERMNYLSCCAVVRAGTSPAAFERFLAWLEMPENYELFLTGDKDAPAGYAAFPYLDLFLSDTLERARLAERTDLPVNFLEELEAIEYPSRCPIDAEASAAIQKAGVEENGADYTRLWNNYDSFIQALLKIWSTGDTENAADALFDDSRYEDVSDLLALYRDALN